VPGMAAQRRGWPHRVEVTENTRPAGLTSRDRPARARGRHPYLFRRFPPSYLLGCDVGIVREWAAQCHGFDTGLAAQLPHGASRWNSAGIRFPCGVRAPAWWGFASEPGARVVSGHLMLWLREWARKPRALDGLERGGVSPEGASSPRARRSFGGTAPGPSSEAEICPRRAGADHLMGH
jgi:hypothetical protein